MDTVDARWSKFVRPLDARHFNFMRPTLKFHAAMDSAFSLFWSPYTKFWRKGRREAPERNRCLVTLWRQDITDTIVKCHDMA